MSENPLLPHAQLRALYALMVETRSLERRRGAKPAMAREALLAATTMQLEPGDLLAPQPGDIPLAASAPSGKDKRRNGLLTLPEKTHSRLALCTAAARGLQAGSVAGSGSLILTYANAGAPEPGWQDALLWAQQAELPLLLVCADATGGRPQRGKPPAEPALTWQAITTLARKSKIPVISVDGEDAVAVYRVMQECLLRARLGAGPAVIWAIMTPKGDPLPASQQPIARLRRYMAARRISVR